MLELDEIMRQKEDREFAQLLCRVRTATGTNHDINTMESRVATDHQSDYLHDALHVYRLNKDVDEQNAATLNQLAPKTSSSP